MNPSVLPFRKIPGSKKFKVMRGKGASITILRRFFFVQQCLNISMSEEECFSISLKSGIVKSYRKEREGGRRYQDLPEKWFRLRIPKVFIEVSFSVSLNSATKKDYR